VPTRDRSRPVESESSPVDAFDAFDRSESIESIGVDRSIESNAHHHSPTVIASSPSPSSIIGRYPHPRATDDDDVSIVGDDVFVDRDAFVERSDRRALS